MYFRLLGETLATYHRTSSASGDIRRRIEFVPRINGFIPDYADRIRSLGFAY
jgi:hypothetical protein